MLQERIAELGSGILQFKDDKVYLTGFMSPERLDDYYNRDIDCHFSRGIYQNRKLNWGKIQDEALFVLLNYKEEIICKYQFMVLNKNTIKYKDKENNNRSKTYNIRKCNYTGIYNFVARETIMVDGKKTSVEDNRLFDTLLELKDFFRDTFGVELEYSES